ncbi:MAG: sulfur carrier protein ThiS [Deltaproteobacteria bacterium]|jgi:thiamine biosynthesis protein ThiS|nr:sulfur carrier protein ThiS [Deltaproteobacteria bacterium]
MKLVVNGDAFEVEADPVTVDVLVSRLGLEGQRVAVEVNRRIIRRAAWAETALAEGDAVEVVHFVGGG